MLKISLISVYLSLTLLHAASFEFTSIKRDSSGAISDSGLKIKNEKDVIATGYGTSKQQALNNAFKTAIEQYVGVVIDSETMMKNGKLIKDNILTASNGFIKTYKELSVDKSDGLVEVKINATVKSQDIFNKIKSLNITTISIEGLNGISSKIKDVQARKSTKIKAKNDAEKILKKVVGDFFSNQSVQDMLKIVITDVKIDEEKVSNENTVPMNISYTLEIDYKVYSQKVKQLEQVFENLGAKLHKRVDLPDIHHYGKFTPKNLKKVKKLKNTDFGILKKYGQGYKLDIWKFSEDWSDIYPFNSQKDILWKDIFQIILELQDENGEVLYAENMTPSKTVKLPYGQKKKERTDKLLSVSIVNIKMRYAPYEKLRYQTGFRSQLSKILMPLFNVKVEKLDFSTKQIINVNEIDKIKNITIELEEM